MRKDKTVTKGLDFSPVIRVVHCIMCHLQEAWTQTWDMNMIKHEHTGTTTRKIVGTC